MQKSQGTDNPLALAPRVREKLDPRRRIVDAVQVPLEQGWTMMQPVTRPERRYPPFEWFLPR
jgi:hypothetical protein